MSRNKNIIAILAFAVLGVSVCSCGYNELPPKTSDASKSYLYPFGEFPTQEVRDAVKAAKAEYDEAVKGVTK